MIYKMEGEGEEKRKKGRGEVACDSKAESLKTTEHSAQNHCTDLKSVLVSV